jgi:hypothetical protein
VPSIWEISDHHNHSRRLATPQTKFVSAWCRQLGHRVHYTTYWGQRDPERLLPRDLDVVFIGTHTPTSLLAYALAKVFGRAGAITVIGGPHARCFPQDCLRFFDYVVLDCDKVLPTTFCAAGANGPRS